MHPLKRWLKKNKIQTIDFCKKIGVTKVYFTRIFNYERGMSFQKMVKVQRATNGEVGIDELVKHTVKHKAKLAKERLKEDV